MPLFRSVGGFASLCVAALLASSDGHGAPPASSSAASPADPREATAYEQAGDKLKAAETYERLVAQDPGKRALLATRLVRIYAETGQTNRALAWARVVMETNPDPQAYLAGVHTLLGDMDVAREILEREIARAGESRRKLTLHWQLADVLEKAGRAAEAGRVLDAAARLAKGTPDEMAAQRRANNPHGRPDSSPAGKQP